MGIRRIRRAVREERYEFTGHALDEMDDDELSDGDVRQVLLAGCVVGKLTADPRGVRFIVRGRPRGRGGDVEVVCRFLSAGRLRIITAYEAEE